MTRKLLSILVLLCVFGSNAWAQTPPYSRTVIVNNNGDNAANGVALLKALTGLTPAPSSQNQWLIQLEGGVYDVGQNQVVLQPYVHLAGSGARASFIRGSFQGILLAEGLVQGASNSEIRQLTIDCITPVGNQGCKAVGLIDADAVLTDLRIRSRGEGNGSHWGIRTFDSRPQLDQVVITVDSASSQNNYGIVYGGTSKMNIARSSITAKNGTSTNWGIGLQDSPVNGVMRDSSVDAAGGSKTTGIHFEAPEAAVTYKFDNVSISAYGTNLAIGFGGENTGGLNPDPRVYFKYGKIFGSHYGVFHQKVNIDLVNTEVYGSSIRVHGGLVKIGGSWLRGNGTITGNSSVSCAGNFDGTYAFYPSTCP